MSPIRLVLAWAVGIAFVEWSLLPGAAAWADAIGVPVVLILLGLTTASIRRSRVVVPGSVSAALRRPMRACRIEYGVDLRKVPPIPRRVPSSQVAIVVVVLAVGAAALLVPPEVARGIRSALVPGASIVYVAGLTLAWCWAAALCASGLFLVWYAASDALLADGPASRRENWIRLALPLVALAVAVSASATLPPTVPVLLLAAILFASLATLAMRSLDAIELLWRQRGKDDVFAVGSRWFFAWRSFTYVGVPLTSLALMTRGAWAGAPASPTAWIGGVAGWLGVLGGLGWLWLGPLRLLLLASSDRVGDRPTALRFVDGAPSAAVVGALAARGFRVVEGGGHAAVEIALDYHARRGHEGAADGATRRVAADELLGPRALSELRAADMRARREEVLAALNGIMRVATKMSFEQGSGLWFAPHLWYIWGVSRDTDEVDMITVGPPYHRILSVEARSHCLEVFRATAIDLVFIQDGVIAASAERALAQLFDHFDVWGAHRIEERHFRLMPGIRILIHDFEHGQRLGREGYREPDYDSIGRARILHIMIDRGGNDDDTPDFDTPTREPMGMGLSG